MDACESIIQDKTREASKIEVLDIIFKACVVSFLGKNIDGIPSLNFT